MVESSELRSVPVFTDLPEDQIEWFLGQSEELILKSGDVILRQGDPAQWMFVILEGQLHGRGEFNGETFIFSVVQGNVTGVLPFSRMQHSSVTVRASTECKLLRFSSARFPELIQRMPELAKRLVAVMSDRIRETTRVEQQRDRLAALGKLSAGLAHELNNPASAAKRASSQLRDMMFRIRNASHELGRRELTPAQKAKVEGLETYFTQRDEPSPDALTVNNLEDQLDALFRSHGQNDLWQLSADLARRGVKPDLIEDIYSTLEADTAKAALVRIASLIDAANLLKEIESSTTRISELVKAIKEYTFMDQTPIQDVDIVKGLEGTLTILNHKLKKGVTVHRDYQDGSLLVNSFGSELNQVWTNIIDNAIDAMHGKGEIWICAKREDNCVIVEITDNGPGIPDEALPHIFEPFFTTKGVGEGTGLGLDTVQRIVRKHRGTIKVDSVPGKTKFQVWIPLSDTEKA